MSRYGVKYVHAMDRRYSPLTKEAMVRKYKRMDRDVDYLYKTGIINNLYPVTIKEEVHNYLVYRMNLGVSDSEMDHEVATMKSVFNYCATRPWMSPSRLIPTSSRRSRVAGSPPCRKSW